MIIVNKKLIFLLRALLIILVIVIGVIFILRWLSPLIINNAASIIALSGWVDSLSKFFIVSRAAIYVLIWFNWNKMVHFFIERALSRRLENPGRVSDVKAIEQEYKNIEGQLINWRPKLIGLFVVYEVVMLYSTFG